MSAVFLLFPWAVAYAVPPVTTPAPATPSDIESGGLKQKELQDEQLDRRSTIDDLKVDDSARAAGESEVDESVRFTLSGVSVLGNETLKAQEIIDIVTPFVGREVTGEDLKAISEAITRLYVEKGFVTSKCVIPAQKVEGGVVTLQIEEDKLGQIMLSGPRAYRYNPQLFSRYFHDLQGKIIHLATLDSRLKILSKLPATRIKPVLKKSAYGITNLILELVDLDSSSVVSVSNLGSRFAGTNLLSANQSIVNPSGEGDVLSLNFSGSMKSLKLMNSFAFDYIHPVGEEGGLLRLDGSYMSYKLDPDEVGYPTSDVIRYEGGSNKFSLLYEEPWLDDFGHDTEFWWNLGVERKINQASTIYHTDFLQFNAGSPYVQTEDKLLVVGGGFRVNTIDDLGGDYRGSTAFSLNIKHSLEGVLGSMTSEDVVRKLTNIANGVEPVVGPVGNVEGMDVAFWKAYVSFSRMQLLPYKFALGINFAGEYTNSKKVPSAYVFSGADNGSSGFSYDVALSRALPLDAISGGARGVATVGYKGSNAFSYFRDLTPGCGGRANKRGLNVCTTATPYVAASFSYEGLNVDIRYEPVIEAFEQSQETVKVTAGYRW